MKRNMLFGFKKISVLFAGILAANTVCISAMAVPSPTPVPTATNVTVETPGTVLTSTPTVAPTSLPVVTPTVAPAASAVPVIAPSQVQPTSPVADGSANTTPYTQTTGFTPTKELSELKPLADCFIVFGDSRSCSLVSTLIFDKTWKKIYVCNNFPYADIVATKGSTMLVICGEAGGYYDNGAYTRAYSRFNKISDASLAIKNCTNHYYCNLFGVNDVMIAKRNSTSDYIRMNEAIRSGNGNADVFYQFTAGPISETGTAVLTNAQIEAYNANYKNTKKCAIIDLYSYLKQSGFDVIINDADDTGIHYDSKTNYKILGLILSIADSDALNNTQAPTAVPASTQIPAATPVVTQIPVVTPTPVTSIKAD